MNHLKLTILDRNGSSMIPPRESSHIARLQSGPATFIRGGKPGSVGTPQIACSRTYQLWCLDLAHGVWRRAY